MKVTADAIALGAWATVPADASQALDIGCGTGLLSLMLAQRFPQLRMDALELEPQAALQASENIKRSRFHNRIQVYQADVRQWKTPVRYDFIICNPPFYNKGPKSIIPEKNLAWHTESLTFKDLAIACNELLKEKGSIALLLPQAAMADLEKAMNVYFHLEQRHFLSENKKHSKQRVLSSWRRKQVAVKTDAHTTGLDSGCTETIKLRCAIDDFLLFGN